MMKLSIVFGLLFAFLLSLSLSIAAPNLAMAQETGDEQVVEDPSPNDVRELMRLLADQRIQHWLVEKAASENLAGTGDANVGLRDQLVVGLDRVRSRIEALRQAWFNLPQAPKMLQERWWDEMSTDRKVRSLTYVIIFLFVGAGLEWLYRQYTTTTLLRISLQTHSAPSRQLVAALVRAGIVSAGLLLFALGSIGTFLSFDWQPLVETLVLNLLILIFVVRAVRTLLIFLIAPSVPVLRLVPLPNRMAKHFHRYLFLNASVIALAVTVSDIFRQLTSITDGADSMVAPEALSVTVAMAVLVLVTVVFSIWRSFRLIQKESVVGPVRALTVWRAYLYLLVALTFLLWLIGANALMWSLLIVATLFPILRLLTAWVNHFFDQARTAFHEAAEGDAAPTTVQDEAEAVEGTPEEEAETPELHDPYEVYNPIVLRLVRFVVVIAAVLVLAAAWGTNIFSISASPTFTGKAFSILIDSVFAILIADLIWVWAKTAIDKRMADYKPPEDGQAPGPEARMATLLPLLRIILMVTLLTIVSLSLLSSLGVNIAPLLAGAGVLGIAIGFGAQSLVRDVVSGIFFLIDDAFRIGEYIEIGDLRGTVEGISIRSLRVRHHRGMVHTIPFGELKSLTNHSRDWVIMKLEFRVPFETDLQLVKKLVKKVGAELKANEHYGQSILSTLKSQGVRRMEEFNMVVGVKFMTKPGEQWLVRRDAYQKTRDIFEANGIRLAERNVKVEIQGGDELTEEDKKAVAAAAQQVAAGPQGLPKAIPDEP